MPELESSHLGDCREVPSTRVCKCTISIHGRSFRIYMACMMCDMDLRSFSFKTADLPRRWGPLKRSIREFSSKLHGAAMMRDFDINVCMQ